MEQAYDIENRLNIAQQCHFDIQQQMMIKQYQSRDPKLITSNERGFKSPDVVSVKSDKALRSFNKQSDGTRPFQRKQDKGSQLRKPPGENTSKLIINTSLGNSPNAKMLFSQEILNPQIQTPVATEHTKQRLIRSGKLSFNYHHLKQIQPLNHLTSMKDVGCVQNGVKKQAQPWRQNLNGQIKVLYKQNKELKNRVKVLEEGKKNLQKEIEGLNKKISQMKDELEQKQSTIVQFNGELMKKIEDHEQQKQRNSELEDVILELKQKIKEMGNKESTQKKAREGMSKYSIKQDLEAEVHSLREEVFSMKRLIQNMEIQNIIVSKLRHEVEQQRNIRRIVEYENKGLRQKIMVMIKQNQKKEARKSSKISLKKQLQYSISFSFDK